MSIEATDRRYLNLAGFPCCLVFSKDGFVVKSPTRSSDFSYWLSTSLNQKVPSSSSAAGQNEGLEDFNEIPGDEWLATDYRKVPEYIQEQTLFQENGYAITLLWIEDARFDEDE